MTRAVEQSDECLILCLLAPPPTQNGQQTLEFPLKSCMQPLNSIGKEKLKTQCLEKTETFASKI